jgi:transposase
VYLRRKQNKSGTVSVQVIRKAQGKYKVLHSVGVATQEDEITELERQGRAWIEHAAGQAPLIGSERDQWADEFVGGLRNDQVRLIGPELVFGTRYDAMGYGALQEPMLRHMVLARLAFPGSKLKTVDYLRRFQGIEVSVDRLYRALDRIGDQAKERIEEITCTHAKARMGTRASIVFYDMTTLHFESDEQDDLRVPGYSKSGKHQHPQVQLGLLVGPSGAPIAYDMFPGNLFEGHTLLPVLARIQQRFELEKPIVVADAGLLNKENITLLKKHGYTFILGGRIKNESDGIKERILGAAIPMDEHIELQRADKTRLIVHRSEKRAAKDAHNRKRGLERLQRDVKSGRLTKTHINNKGYNRYLRLTGEVQVEIDLEKFQADAAWDGLKGYVTNSKLPATEIIDHYRQLWQIERAFRISKTDLKIRPVHHFQARRIQAHLCVVFIAYAILKDIELVLHRKGTRISLKRACELTANMYQIQYAAPDSGIPRSLMLTPSKEQQQLLEALT